MSSYKLFPVLGISSFLLTSKISVHSNLGPQIHLRDCLPSASALSSPSGKDSYYSLPPLLRECITLSLFIFKFVLSIKISSLRAVIKFITVALILKEFLKIVDSQLLFNE